ncbi:uncharacterized protein FOMMEDRAFT_22095 [Fomitiporia mediterranea MF3/22]|uniref:uncharacterized protein n=1 Tax=Fomitiporia mediterranea (strain MF3/22) TaxID=694068 RepID=UPI0004407649|nr:uncharacterized protein FOMMEDRAFT_22095 [Fomitiporia mediterranea MF3/22]EJD01746.1 hypothetical protein FOMMEDRAFT_22095 [Fomitiporia mediterranea MF3/22]
MYTRILSSSHLTKPTRLLPSLHRSHLYPYPQSRALAALHATAVAYRAEKPKGQAPPASRDPKEDTLLDQNPHLKHAVTSQGGLEGRDVGKGNADPERPALPSHKVSGKKVKKEEEKLAKGKAKGKGKRGLHTSAVWSADTKGKEGEAKHTADSYFKDVDQSPPPSNKTFVVDGSADAASSSSGDDEGEFRPATHRPHEQYADPKKEYATVSKDEPYEAPVEMNGQEKGEQKEQKLRYGATKRDALRNAPKGEEGPQDKHAGGVKPERSS